MVVMPRERWTDEQLDKAFGRIDGDLRELRVEMRKGFEKIDQRFEEMDKRFDQVDKRFEQVDKRFEQVDKRFEQVDKRFEQVDKRFERFDKRFELLFSWFAGLSCAIIGSLVAVSSRSFLSISRNLRDISVSRSAPVATQIPCCVSCGSRTCC